MATEYDTASEVSWQTAFFLLFSIAFSAISQPCGQFLGMHSQRRIWLRTSPFLCLADTLVIIAQFQYYSAKGDGPRDALRRIVQTRFAGTTPAKASAGQIEPTTLSSLEVDITDASVPNIPHPQPQEEIVPSHLFPNDGDTLASVEQKLQLRFLLGIFPLFPAIKLYTLVGIPWTQAFAAMYIASILSVEGLLWCAKPYEQVLLLPPLNHDIFISNASTLSRYLETVIDRRIRPGVTILVGLIFALYYYLCTTSQETYSTVVVCIVLYSVAAFGGILDTVKIGTSDTLLSYFCHCLLPLHSALLVQYEFSHVIDDINIWLLVFSLTIVIAFSSTAPKAHGNISSPIVLAEGFGIVMATVILIILFSLMSGQLRDIILDSWYWHVFVIAMSLLLLPLGLEVYREYRYVLFAANNLLVFMLCYAYIYDPTGTFNPGWEAIWG